MNSPSPRSWLAYYTPKSEARLRLFCVPYAGGGAMIYRTWAKEMPASVDVCPVQLPGRETRMSEPRFRRVDALVAKLAEVLRPLLNMPFCLFGHSMGGLIAFELTRELRRRGEPQPQALFVSGRTAPHLGPVNTYYHLPDAALLDTLEGLDVSRREFLRNEELMQVMLPLLRADLEICDTYTYRSEAPLSQSVTAFAGRDDPLATPERVQAWQKETTGLFRHHQFDGGHFFLHSAGTLFLQTLREELTLATGRLDRDGTPG